MSTLRLTNNLGTRILSLLSETGLYLAKGGWNSLTSKMVSKYTHSLFGMTADDQHYDRVVETFQMLTNNNDATVAPALAELDRIQEWVCLWHKNQLRQESIWLEAQSDREAHSRRSLVYNLTVKGDKGTMGGTSLLELPNTSLRVTLTRHPLWESTSSCVVSASGISTLGGAFTLNSLPDTGTAPARIEDFSISHNSSVPLARAWVGIREYNEGIASFEPLWELEDGSTYTDTTSGSDSNASGSSKLTVNFATMNSNAKRAEISVNDVVLSSPEDMIGRYVVLCRSKVDTGMTVALQLRHGFYDGDDDSFLQAEPVYIENTNWRLRELGEVSIPPSGWRAANANPAVIDNVTIQVWAELIEGSGNLDLDCLVLIPANHYVSFDSAAIWWDAVGPTFYNAHIYTFENDILDAQGSSVNVPSAAHSALPHSSRGWYRPMLDYNRLVFAAEGDTEHILSDTVTLEMTTLARWLSYSSNIVSEFSHVT